MKIVTLFTAAEFIQEAVANDEGVLSSSGQLCVRTGDYTGRAANDKYVRGDRSVLSYGQSGRILYDDQTWLLRNTVETHMNARDKMYETFFETNGKKFRLIAELAWHCAFVHAMFNPISPADDVDLTIIDVPSCRSDEMVHGTRSKTFVALDLIGKVCLIGGTAYAGEIKKSVFSYMNYELPPRGILPLHSSATTEHEGWNTTLFFGLSGTGKTTLSAYPGSRLVGDDETLWTDEGVSNIESGCYAKIIDLNPGTEPVIWSAVNRFGTVVENVRLDGAMNVDYANSEITVNTRAAYPLSHVEGAHEPGTVVNHPKNIVMLTCDAFGILPGASLLSNDQAIYHFLSGYTAKAAGTESGVIEPQAVFSPCFGAPFMMRKYEAYASLLLERIKKHETKVWLVNTGWIGGSYGVGKRAGLAETRSLISRIVSGKAINDGFFDHPMMNLRILNGFNDSPWSTWASNDDYHSTCSNLIKRFNDNENKIKCGLTPMSSVFESFSAGSIVKK